MKGELIINGADAYETWGVSMGKGFLDALDSFVPMKEYVTNSSRLEHGEQVLVGTPRVGARDVTLGFTIMGENENIYRARRKAFEAVLQQGFVNVVVPALGEEVYKLLYIGKSTTYNMNVARCFSEVTIKFREPNPSDR